MTPMDPHTLLDDLLAPWQAVIGADFTGYRNHCQRMLAVALILHPGTAEEQEKFAIAAAFHDIGLWTANTLDYLEPSVPPALDCLRQRGREDWAEEIGLMITEHHRLRPVRDGRYPLVEVFRRADLADFSLGLLRGELRRASLEAIRERYPNAGFHAGLVRKAGAWFLRHPLNPAPMMKW